MFGFACVCSQCYIIFVPSRPSDPMLATTSIISQLKPGKTTVISSSPRTVNGEESAENQPAATWTQSGLHLRIRNTHSLERRRFQDRNLASRINHKVNLNSLGPPCQEPRCRRANGPDHNRLSTVPKYGCLVGYPCRLFGPANHSPDLWAPQCFASAG